MSDNSLKGKNVVVLGGSRGIGREIVRRVHAELVSVLAVARGRGCLENLAQELTGVRILALDASQPDAPHPPTGAVASSDPGLVQLRIPIPRPGQAMKGHRPRFDSAYADCSTPRT
jgi:short chain dehydrogenase